jgi:deoxyadenosine/deoxycytidine kinase
MIIQNNNNLNTQDQLSHKFFISIEGNIGAGKSTFLKKITNALSLPYLLEPCAEWQNINGYNLLNEFYRDIKRWAYSFQLYAFLTRVESIEKKLDMINSNLFISERSIFADRYVFGDVCYNDGNMSELEWNMYKKWFDWTIERSNKRILPSGIIYLKVAPDLSHQRVNLRGRSEEKSLPIEYLLKLNQKYDLLFFTKKHSLSWIKDIPILIIDCNEDFENNSKIWDNMVELVKDFIYTNFEKSFFDKGIKYGSKSSSYSSSR